MPSKGGEPTERLWLPVLEAGAIDREILDAESIADADEPSPRRSIPR